MDKPTEEKIYKFIVEDLSEEQQKMEDIPYEYLVVKQENIVSGLMVWGRYFNGWHPNPSTRYLIADLLSQNAAFVKANTEAVKIIDNLLTALVLTMRGANEHLDDTQERILRDFGHWLEPALRYLDKREEPITLATADWIEKLPEKESP